MKKTNYKAHNTKVIPYRNRKAPAYPNAAERSYLMHKAMDTLLTAASSAGVFTALLCIFVFL